MAMMYQGNCCYLPNSIENVQQNEERNISQSFDGPQFVAAYSSAPLPQQYLSSFNQHDTFVPNTTQSFSPVQFQHQILQENVPSHSNLNVNAKEFVPKGTLGTQQVETNSWDERSYPNHQIDGNSVNNSIPGISDYPTNTIQFTGNEHLDSGQAIPDDSPQSGENRIFQPTSHNVHENSTSHQRETKDYKTSPRYRDNQRHERYSFPKSVHIYSKRNTDKDYDKRHHYRDNFGEKRDYRNREDTYNVHTKTSGQYKNNDDWDYSMNRQRKMYIDKTETRPNENSETAQIKNEVTPEVHENTENLDRMTKPNKHFHSHQNKRYSPIEGNQNINSDKRGNRIWDRWPRDENVTEKKEHKEKKLGRHETSNESHYNRSQNTESNERRAGKTRNAWHKTENIESNYDRRQSGNDRSRRTESKIMATDETGNTLYEPGKNMESRNSTKHDIITENTKELEEEGITERTQNRDPIDYHNQNKHKNKHYNQIESLEFTSSRNKQYRNFDDKSTFNRRSGRFSRNYGEETDQNTTVNHNTGIRTQGQRNKMDRRSFRAKDSQTTPISDENKKKISGTESPENVPEDQKKNNETKTSENEQTNSAWDEKEFKKQRSKREERYTPELFKEKTKYRDPKMERESPRERKSTQSYEEKYTRTSLGKEDQRIEDQFDKSYEKLDEEYKQFLTELTNNVTIETPKIREQEQDLFEVPPTYSLAHCVAEDFRMSSGIAVAFKNQFRGVDELLAQRQKSGGLATLKIANRYIYYLVTKPRSREKPTYKDFWCSMKALRDHIEVNNVHQLAIPKLGCGLDKLDWSTVKHMMEFLFRNVQVEILYCRYGETVQNDDSFQKIPHSVKIYDCDDKLVEVEERTLILYFSTADNQVTEVMEELATKFDFLDKFKAASKQIGSVIKHKTDDHLLCGCVVGESAGELFDFTGFRKCLEQINEDTSDGEYTGIAMPEVCDDRDRLLHHKVVTMLFNYLKNMDVYVYLREPGESFDET